MNKKILYISLLIIVLGGLIIYSFNSDNFYFNTPDEAILKSFGEIYANTGNLYYPANESGLTPYTRLRGTGIIDGKIVPLKFLGFPLFFGVLDNFSPIFFYLITSICGAFVLLWFFLFVKKISKNSKTAVISTSFLLFLPFFWYWSNHAFIENVSSMLFFLVGYYFLISYFENKNSVSNLALFSIFFGVSLAFRYDMIILIFASIIPFFMKLKTVKPAHFIISFLIIFLFISPSLISSKVIYGSFFSYGEKILNDKYEILRNFSLENVFNYFYQSFIFLPIFALSILSILTPANYKKDKIKQILVSLLLYILLFSLLIFSFNPIKQPNILHESYTRYFLWFYFGGIIFYSIFVNTIKNKKIKISFIFITFLIFISAITPIIYDVYKTKETNEQYSQYITKNIPPNSIVVVGQLDKALHSNNNIVSIYLFDNKKREIDYTIFGKFVNESEREIYLFIPGLDKNKIYLELKEINKSFIDINGDNLIYKIVVN